MRHDGGMEDTNATPHHNPSNRRLERPTEGRVIAGVAAALANHTGISVGLVRLGFVVATLFAGFGAVVYAAGWLLLPNEDAEMSPAEAWRANLTTRGRRTGAVLMGIAALIVISAAVPVVALAAVAILVGAALLAPKDPVMATQEQD